VKVVASDAPSHSPGEALYAERVSSRFEVDATPPGVLPAARLTYGTCTIIGGTAGVCAPALSSKDRLRMGRIAEA